MLALDQGLSAFLPGLLCSRVGDPNLYSGWLSPPAVCLNCTSQCFSNEVTQPSSWPSSRAQIPGLAQTAFGHLVSLLVWLAQLLLPSPLYWTCLKYKNAYVSLKGSSDFILFCLSFIFLKCIFFSLFSLLDPQVIQITGPLSLSCFSLLPNLAPQITGFITCFSFPPST